MNRTGGFLALTDSRSQTNTEFPLLFTPVAYIPRLLHEFGHWRVGEMPGNRMAPGLDYSWPTEGRYLREEHSPAGSASPLT
ncbi:MAG TPA: hypothetical protein VMW43_06710 [Bacteroidota bacterium]|nr:hypothetical protein [Bacteroidota bacterium]